MIAGLIGWTLLATIVVASPVVNPAPLTPPMPLMPTPADVGAAGTPDLGRLPGRLSERWVVAIDPGHGGSNLGAAGLGASFEKRVTLELARRLRDRLATKPQIDVVLCRNQDVLVPIRARARCVRDARADLLVSLHANASPPGVAAGTRRGFELYVLSPQEVEDDVAVAVAEQTDAAEAAWAAHQIRSAAVRSAIAAHAIELRLKETLGPRSSRGIRQRGAALDVLRGTGAAGVLVEVGFLDHPEEGAQLVSSAGQEKLAQALTRALVDLAPGGGR